MEKLKPVILVICDYYLPGFESGGAMRTLVNMIDRLGDTYRFRVVTRDHDGPLNKTPYTNVRLNDWNRVGNADVYYLAKNNVRPHTIKQLVRDTDPDVLYLNSFFSPLTIFTLLLRRFNRIDPIPVILAPEGELVPGALMLKPLKKQLYIRTAKLLQLLASVIWKAASQSEQADVENICGKDINIFVAPNMPPRMILDNFDQSVKPKKKVGQIKMVFLSRFMRKKNFKWLLDHIRTAKGDITIDIYGPLEDVEYWHECQEIIKTLPGNIKIEAKGPVPHEKVAETLAKYHFFVLPTLGENFGHIFIEALAAGCPLIISDRSPWRNLEKQGIGWDIPLEEPETWLSVINEGTKMDDHDYQKISQTARNFAVAWLSDPAIEESNREVLEFALAAKRKLNSLFRSENEGIRR